MPKKHARQIIDKVFITIGAVAMVALLAIGGLSLWASSFVASNVKTELSSQKIFFPPKGSSALDPEEFPGLQKYAGEQVDNAPKAKAYADEFIGVHLQKIADGKTYAEVSTASMANPADERLQAQKATLFQGETLRGLLLNAYAFGTVGMIAQIIALVSFTAGAVMFVLVLFGLRHLKSLS